MTIKLCVISSIRGILAYIERIKTKNTGATLNKLRFHKCLSSALYIIHTGKTNLNSNIILY